MNWWKNGLPLGLWVDLYKKDCIFSLFLAVKTPKMQTFFAYQEAAKTILGYKDENSAPGTTSSI